MIKTPLLLLITVASLSCMGMAYAAGGWVPYVNPEIGYRVQYPSDLFGQVEPDDPHNGAVLDARDQQAVLYVFGGANERRRTPSDLAADLAHMDDIHRVTYSRVAASWFVLSGFLNRSGWAGRGIFYERIAVSPDGSRLAGFRLEYSETQRATYDHLIGSIGQSLRFLPRGAMPTSPSIAATKKPHVSTYLDAGHHLEWCQQQYSTYDPVDDRFTRFDGLRVPCLEGQ